MTTAFIITLDLDVADAGALQETAQEIAGLVDGMYDVVEVKPWARPITAPTLPTLPAAGGTIPPFPAP